jgi:DNA-binding SARP family transcriptional activator
MATEPTGAGTTDDTPIRVRNILRHAGQEVSRMRFRLLGPTELLHRDEWVGLSGQRTPTLISALLLRANRTADAQWLIGVVWPDGQPASASANLRQYVAKTRETLRRFSLDQVACLRSTPFGYRLEVARDELDLTMFQDLTTLGRRALTADDPVTAHDHLSRAIRLWRGHLCEGVPGYPELQVERVYWEEARLLAAESLLAARLALGEHGEVTAELRRLIAEQPLREELRGMLMVSLYRCHRRSDALDVFTETRALLVAEFGIEPGPYLRRLQRALLMDDPELVGGALLGPGWAAGADRHGHTAATV